MTRTGHGAQTHESGSRTLSIIAMVCGAVAVLFLPIIFGPLGGTAAAN